MGRDGHQESLCECYYSSAEWDSPVEELSCSKGCGVSRGGVGQGK